MVIGEIHEKIMTVDQLTDGGYYVMKNMGRGKYVYEGEDQVMCMGLEVKYGACGEYVWQAKLNADKTFSFASLKGNYVPVLKAGGKHSTTTEAEKGSFKVGLQNAANGRFWLQNKANNICWNGDADTFTGWAAKGGNSDYEIYPVVLADLSNLVEITYDYYIDGKKVHTEKAMQAKGGEYAAPTLNNEFLSYDTEKGIVEAPATVKVTCQEKLPFEKSESYDKAKWYYISITASKLFFNYAENAYDMTLNEKLPETLPGDQHKFCFVGNVIDGFTIYNKAAGPEMILTAPTEMLGGAGGESFVIMDYTPVLEGYNETWDIMTSPHLDGGFLLYQHGLIDNKVNKRGDKLAFWHHNSDAGSTVFFTSEENLVSDFVNDIRKDYKAHEGYIGGYDPYVLPELDKVKDMETLKTCLDFLNSAKLNTIQEGKYYRIKNYARNLSWDNGIYEGWGGYISTTHYNTLPNWVELGGSSSISCATDKLDDAGCFWTFEKAEGENCFYIKNVNKGEYVVATAADHDIYLETTPNKAEAGIYKVDAFEPRYRYSFTCVSEGVNAEWNQLHASGRGVMNCNGNERSGSAWFIMASDDLTVNMNTYEGAEGSWGAIHAPFGLKLPAGVSAYTGKVEGNEMKLSAIGQEVPANTAVILKGAENEYTLNIAEVAGTIENNDLQGTNMVKELAEGENASYVVLGAGELGLGMYNPAANKLERNSVFYGPVATGAQALKIVLGEVTGVESVEVANPANQVYYDLSGRRVAQPVKGIYVVNGKKVLVK